MRPPKILHILPTDGTGGAEIAARSGIAEDGRLHVHFLAGNPKRNVAGATVTTGRSRAYLTPGALCAAFVAMRTAAPDVIVFSMWRSVGALLLARLLRPNVCRVVLLHSDRTVHPVDALAHRVMIGLADEVWADAAGTLQARVPHHSRGRVVSFITGEATAVTAARSRPRFCFWGRLHEHKGLDRALAIISALRHRGLNPSFTIAGPDGGQRSALERQVDDLALNEQVCFRGAIAREQIAELAAHASFYLQPSRQEGAAMSVMEAMQLGLVPVVTAVGGIADYCRDDENALIVDPDQPAAVAKRLSELLDDPVRFARMRQAALSEFDDTPTYAASLRAAAHAALEAR